MTWNLGDYTWNDFEDTKDGKLSIGGTFFYMRIGLFMGRATQVIQTHGEFVRMRLAPEFEGCDLKVLDPSDPYACTYRKFNNEIGWYPPSKPWNFGEIVNTTLRNRTGELAKNLKRNNALLMKMTKRKRK